MWNFVNRAIAFTIAGLFLGSTSANATYDYTDSLRDYFQCAETYSGAAAATCQKNAKIRLECAETENEDDCLRNQNPQLLEQKKQEEVRLKSETAAWTEGSNQRKTYGDGKWRLLEGDPDPIDDSRIVTVFLLADSGRSGLRDQKIILTLRCASNKTSLVINWHDYVTDSTSVTYRFDKKRPITSTWPSSTDNSASFYDGGGVEIAKKLMITDSFVARTIPYNENPVTAIFDTRGLSKAIEPLREACEW